MKNQQYRLCSTRRELVHRKNDHFQLLLQLQSEQMNLAFASPDHISCSENYEATRMGTTETLNHQWYKKWFDFICHNIQIFKIFQKQGTNKMLFRLNFRLKQCIQDPSLGSYSSVRLIYTKNTSMSSITSAYNNFLLVCCLDSYRVVFYYLYLQLGLLGMYPPSQTIFRLTFYLMKERRLSCIHEAINKLTIVTNLV